jgi:hypothetical protein
MSPLVKELQAQIGVVGDGINDAQGPPTASTTQQSDSRCAMSAPMQTIEW